MMRRLGLVLVLPLLLVLAACAPTQHAAIHVPPKVHSTSSASASPSGSATPTAAAKPPVPAAPIVPANYLVEGTPNVPDANGEWYGEWAFYTDATKSVWCQFTIFSADNPGATCSIVPAARAKVTYPLPAGSSAGCVSSDWDGYTLAMGGSADDLQPNADAGWDQCFTDDPPTAADLAKTLVLPDGATLAVAPFSCTVTSGVATCGETNPGSATVTLTLGLHTASFHSTS